MRGVRLGKGMALGMPNSSLPTPLEAYEKTGPGCSQWCLAEGGWWWTEIETTELQTGHKEAFSTSGQVNFATWSPEKLKILGGFSRLGCLKL